MANVELAIILLGAFWTGTSVVFTGIQLMNDVKYRILVGAKDGVPFTRSHRRQMLYLEWMPIRGGLATVSLVLAIIIGKLPSLADSTTMPPSFPDISLITAVVPACGFLFFLFFGIIEWRIMRREVRKLSLKEIVALVIDAERRLAVAHLTLDLGVIGDLLHDEYVIMQPGGRLEAKQDVLDSYASGERHWDSAEVEQFDVKIYGEMARVVGVWKAKGTNTGVPFDYQARFISIWIVTGSGWKNVSYSSAEIHQA